MRSYFTGLWHHGDFVKLWAAQIISHFGTQISSLALPLTAVLLLEATPAQMGLLTAAGTAPFLLLGLFAGVWVDRHRRRPILVVTDVGRAMLLMTIPAAAVLGILRIEHLYIIAFLVGILNLFFVVAYRAFLPSLIGRKQLIEGNSKLEMSRSAAQIAGPGLAGGLVEWVTAPVALAVDALSFVVSALFLGLIQTPEPPPMLDAQRRHIWKEVGEGLELVVSHRQLRAIAGCTGTANLFGQILRTVLVLYITRNLGIGPSLLGLIFASGNVGFLCGTLLSGPIIRRFGLGSSLAGALILAGAGYLLIPLASGRLVVVLVLLVTAQFLIGLGVMIYDINQVSLRQAITPDHLQGRMNATMTFVVGGIAPIGGLLGGALGETIGLRSTLLVAALGEFLAVTWLLFSPIRSLREQPESVEAVPLEVDPAAGSSSPK